MRLIISTTNSILPFAVCSIIMHKFCKDNTISWKVSMYFSLTSMQFGGHM
uniref:Uncharacterized protein n=1 Tax=Arundo donax TaxID=35708 RepID=A0A0A8YDN1_ARUDO